jgi:acyl-CoA thioesterase I
VEHYNEIGAFDAMKALGRILIATLAAAFVACSPADTPPSVEKREAPPSAAATAPAAPKPASDVPRIVILGDSLTAGLGLDRAQSFPSLLQARLDREGYDYHVVNAGVSGDTSAGGLRRLDWALEGNVRVLVVELGANDGLRGLPVSGMKKNLGEIITRAQARGITVILAGMEAPPNYGPQYTDEFRRAFRELATTHNVPLIPFLLEGVAGLRGMNQGDGIHPNREGARIVENTVWRALEPVLEAPADR